MLKVVYVPRPKRKCFLLLQLDFMLIHKVLCQISIKAHLVNNMKLIQMFGNHYIYKGQNVNSWINLDNVTSITALQMNSSNATFPNSISPHLLWYNSAKSITLFINPILNFIISTTCLINVIILNTYMKKLHKTFKTLINMILIHNILSEISLTSLNIYMLTSHTQDLIACTLRQTFTGPHAYMTLYSIAAMSFLRYHIA